MIRRMKRLQKRNPASKKRVNYRLRLEGTKSLQYRQLLARERDRQ